MQMAEDADHGEADQGPLSARIAALPRVDRRLLLALVLGLGFGPTTALARGGMIALDADSVYRVLTLHGTSAFFWWLYLAQGALMTGATIGTFEVMRSLPIVVVGGHAGH
jgi:hypothetical protein